MDGWKSKATIIPAFWPWTVMVVLGLTAEGCNRRVEDPSTFLKGFSAHAFLKKISGFIDLGPSGGDAPGSPANLCFAADAKFAPGTKEGAIVKELKKALEAEVISAGARLLHNDGEQSTDDGLWGFNFQYEAAGRLGRVRVWLVKSEQARFGGHYLMITINEG
jgi:hypothetical protein